MRSDAVSVGQYLSELSSERRAALEIVRNVILKNLPPGYEEVMNWGMITYHVPFESFSDTYNRKPLMYAALASQKNHMALYLTAIYLDENSRDEFIAQYRASGKKLDVAKSCVRFKTIDDLPLELIGKTVALYRADDFVNRFKQSRKEKKRG